MAREEKHPEGGREEEKVSGQRPQERREARARVCVCVCAFQTDLRETIDLSFRVFIAIFRRDEFTNQEVEVSERELREKVAAKRADDERKRKQLAEWKAEKELQKEEERQRRERVASREKERKRAEEREKRESAAALLREYQKKKRLEKELAKLKERAESRHSHRRKVTAVDLVQLWERDRIFLQQRKDLCMREELERREIEERKKRIASTFQVHAERNPQRLLQATEAHLHRGATAREPESTLKQANYIRNVSHLKVPTWRSNLPRGVA